jgi:tetratricopeptide (TPR) repeat protein
VASIAKSFVVNGLRSLVISSTIVLPAAVTFASSPANSSPRSGPSLVPIPTDARTIVKVMFGDSDYVKAQAMLVAAEKSNSDDPLVYTLSAAYAYNSENWEKVNFYGSRTRQRATAMMSRNALRGNLYTAVGLFIEGTYKYKREGTVAALNQLQQVLVYLEKAEKINSRDPELNLIKGYMELLLAVSLPIADAELAIERLEKYAEPKFLAYRGIALGYRDLGKYDRALQYLKKAQDLTPNNPELQYLSSQINYRIGRSPINRDRLNTAIAGYDRALTKRMTLPTITVAEIVREKCQVLILLDRRPRDCDTMYDYVRQKNGYLGAKNLPFGM